jgi:hypothetical protein
MIIAVNALEASAFMLENFESEAAGAAQKNQNIELLDKLIGVSAHDLCRHLSKLSYLFAVEV